MSSKIKIQNKSQLTILKQNLDDFITEFSEKINCQESMNELNKYIKNEESKEKLKIILENLPEKTFTKISKRIKFQNNITMKFLEEIIEEEDLKIESEEFLFFQEETDEKLLEKVKEKKNYLNDKEIPKIEKKIINNENLFKESTKKFFNNFPIPPSLNQIKINVIKNNKDNVKSSFPIDIVINHFIQKNEENGNLYLKQIQNLNSQTNQIENLLMNEYKNLENSFQEIKENIICINNRNNEIEDDLIKNNIIF